MQLPSSLSSQGQKKKFSYISGNGILSPSSKNKKFPSEKRSYLFWYFGKWNFLIFSLNKALLIFRETEIPKKFLIFQEIVFPAQRTKKNSLLKSFLYFGKCKFPAPSLKNFLYFRKELTKHQKQTKNLLWRNFLSLVTFLQSLQQ